MKASRPRSDKKAICIFCNFEVAATSSFNRLELHTVKIQLVELYQSSKANISEHIRHIFEEGELDENSVVRKFRTVQKARFHF